MNLSLRKVRCFPSKPVAKFHHVCDTPGGKLQGEFVFMSGKIPLRSRKKKSGQFESQFQCFGNSAR